MSPLRARASLHYRTWSHRARVVEAMLLLSVFGAAQRQLRMTLWSRCLGRPAAVPASWGSEVQTALQPRGATTAERRAMSAVRRAAEALPWTPSCLAEAATAQVLLRQAGASGVVVIGLRRPTDPQSDAAWDTHAWLLGREGALTGGPAAKGFTAATVYEVPGGLTAAAVSPRSAQ